jgi:Holliday junction resolvase-like predicted endonuclease
MIVYLYSFSCIYYYNIWLQEKRAQLAEENYSLLVKYLQKGKILQSVQRNKSQLIIALANWFTMKNGQLYYKKPNIEYDVCLEVATRSKKNAIREAHVIPGKF